MKLYREYKDWDANMLIEKALEDPEQDPLAKELARRLLLLLNRREIDRNEEYRR